MSHTVVAIFENFEQAREAASNLYSNGFNDSNVDLSVQDPGQTDKRGDYSDANRNNRNDDDSVGSFFDNLFGNDNEIPENILTQAVGARSSPCMPRATMKPIEPQVSWINTVL